MLYVFLKYKYGDHKICILLWDQLHTFTLTSQCLVFITSKVQVELSSLTTLL